MVKRRKQPLVKTIPRVLLYFVVIPLFGAAIYVYGLKLVNFFVASEVRNFWLGMLIYILYQCSFFIVLAHFLHLVGIMPKPKPLFSRKSWEKIKKNWKRI